MTPSTDYTHTWIPGGDTNQSKSDLGPRVWQNPGKSSIRIVLIPELIFLQSTKKEICKLLHQSKQWLPMAAPDLISFCISVPQMYALHFGNFHTTLAKNGLKKKITFLITLFHP